MAASGGPCAPYKVRASNGRLVMKYPPKPVEADRAEEAKPFFPAKIKRIDKIARY